VPRLFAAFAEPLALPTALLYPRGEGSRGYPTAGLTSIACCVLEVDPSKIHQPRGYCLL